MRILVIEDEESVRQTLQDLLELNGHEVLAAGGGREGVRRAAERPDFIFCDISMPDLDGFGVLDALHADPAVREVPFVFLTAKSGRADQRLGMARGADDYLTKPFTEKEILDTIAARTRRQRPLRERIEQLVAARTREVQADWSHELLTPLNGILGGLQLIESEADTLDRGELKGLLQLIHAGADRQKRLARKLIRFFELERGGPEGAAGAAAAADTAVRGGAVRAAVAGRRLSDLRLAAEPAAVGGPETLLADAVAELVENACRFSAPGTPVTVTGTTVAGRYRIEVGDRGGGMTPAECAAVGPFTQFRRAQREQQGLGLGLAIARLATARLGGGLELAPGADGVGLRAILLLPAAGGVAAGAGRPQP